MKRIRLCSDGLNSYGFRLLPGGGDLSAFMANPVLLYNHQSGVIGLWEEIERNEKEVTAVPRFDLDDDLGAKIGRKYENGFLRAASVGIEILETSSDPAFLLPGQSRPTVTRWRLRETSIVDVPADKDALVLYDQSGTIVNLNNGGDCPLPLILDRNMNEFKTLALLFGLPDTATLSDVQQKYAQLKAKADEADTLMVRLSAIESAQKTEREGEIKTLLDAAVTDGRLNADSRAAFQQLFDGNHDAAKLALSSIPVPAKLSAVPASPGTATGLTYNGKTFDEMRKENPAALQALKTNDLATYKRLYEAQYGIPYKV